MRSLGEKHPMAFDWPKLKPEMLFSACSVSLAASLGKAMTSFGASLVKALTSIN